MSPAKNSANMVHRPPKRGVKTICTSASLSPPGKASSCTIININNFAYDPSLSSDDQRFQALLAANALGRELSRLTDTCHQSAHHAMTLWARYQCDVKQCDNHIICQIQNPDITTSPEVAHRAIAILQKLSVLACGHASRCRVFAGQFVELVERQKPMLTTLVCAVKPEEVGAAAKVVFEGLDGVRDEMRVVKCEVEKERLAWEEEERVLGSYRVELGSCGTY